MASKKPRITLFTPGNRRDFIEKSKRFEPDGIIIDFEDAVPIALKAKVRDEIGALIPTLDQTVLVRVNNEPNYLEDDLKAIVSRHLYGIMLPMAESAENVRNADAIITRLERERGLEPDSIRVFASLETAMGCYRCFEVATAARRIEAVTFGSAEDGDLQRTLKSAWSAEGTELLYARSKVLLEGRAAGLPMVLDGAFSDVENDDDLRTDCTLSKRLGYDGRTVIHPRHVAIARQIYLPSAAEIDHYTRMVAAFEAAEKQGLAAIAWEGKLVDYAMYKKARDFIAG
ncbi:MAG: CoA ester lyase [Alphaproteobacteria bacterium]